MYGRIVFQHYCCCFAFVCRITSACDQECTYRVLFASHRKPVSEAADSIFGAQGNLALGTRWRLSIELGGVPEGQNEGSDLHSCDQPDRVRFVPNICGNIGPNSGRCQEHRGILEEEILNTRHMRLRMEPLTRNVHASCVVSTYFAKRFTRAMRAKHAAETANCMLPIKARGIPQVPVASIQCEQPILSACHQTTQLNVRHGRAGPLADSCERGISWYLGALLCCSPPS